MKIILVLLCSIAVFALAEDGTLALNQALELARQNSPSLNAAQLRSAAAEKKEAVVGRWENPTLDMDVEGVGGDNRGADAAEYTVGLKQQIPLGGKGRKDRAVARRTVEVFGHVLRQEALALEAEVRRVFVELMVQQEIGRVRAEQEQLGRAFVEVARRRLEAGSGSELDVLQAELALDEIKLAQTCCFGDLKAEQERLASLLNVPAETLPEVSGSYYELDSMETLTLDEDFPGLQILATEAEKLRAQALRAKAGDVPDVTLGAGVRHESASNMDTFVVSASFPLPFSRRGQTEYAAGLMQADAVLAEYEQTRRGLEREMKALQALYAGTQVQVEIIRSQLIPKAEQAHQLSWEGYEAGRFSWLELIAAQQNLASVRIRHIETLREAHLLRVELSKFMKEGMSL